ncbi:hypothetical protein BV25DRAFT_1828994 [Artomyces pyxidatus]|uniref:Uncharacterized protein n=1 Tax=Artomyces pyxidatus TaxID=48021 RepID=A0ACB8SSI8_9AGAM|nr:hypothetical protein BV25DRAFT_1828994 [Artomyces pyxidatus]
MPPEVKFTPYGIPYVVEFANVSIWPRPPMGPAASAGPDAAALTSPLTRSNTMPHLQTHKPLPSLPTPQRSKSLKIFKTTITARSEGKSERAGKQQEKQDPERPVCRRTATVSAGTQGAMYRHAKVFGSPSSSCASLFSSSQVTLVDLEMEDAPPAQSAPREALTTRFGGLYIQFPDAPSSLPPIPSAPASDQVAVTKASRGRLHKLSRTIAKAVLAEGMDTPARCAQMLSSDSKDAEERAELAAQTALFKGTYGQVRAAFRAAGLVTTPCEEEGPPEATRLGALFVANRDGRGAVVFTKVVLWG